MDSDVTLANGSNDIATRTFVKTNVNPDNGFLVTTRRWAAHHPYVLWKIFSAP